MAYDGPMGKETSGPPQTGKASDDPRAKRLGFCIAVDPNDDEGSIDAITNAVMQTFRDDDGEPD